MSGTQIDDLLNDINSKNLSNEENSMVDAIISDLNSGGGGGGVGGGGGGGGRAPPRVGTQASMPQITPEEKEMLMKQQYIEQQRMQAYQQQQQQQHQQQQQQQQHQQQHQQHPQQQQQIANTDSTDFRSILMSFKDTIIVLFLTFLFNFDAINETLKFKDISFLFDTPNNRPTIVAVLVKSVLIAIIFYVIQQFIK
jgi:hypothetical protein